MARIPLPDGGEIGAAFSLSPVLAKGAAAYSMAVYEHARIPVRTRELMRMRVAQLNQCEI